MLILSLNAIQQKKHRPKGAFRNTFRYQIKIFVVLYKELSIYLALFIAFFKDGQK